MTTPPGKNVLRDSNGRIIDCHDDCKQECGHEGKVGPALIEQGGDVNYVIHECGPKGGMKKIQKLFYVCFIFYCS